MTSRAWFLLVVLVVLVVMAACGGCLFDGGNEITPVTNSFEPDWEAYKGYTKNTGPRKKRCYVCIYNI